MSLRGQAWETVCEFVQDRNLRRHMQGVGAAMRRYAVLLGADPDYWEAVGLIHDFDWELHPNLNEHPIKGATILRARGWDEELVRTVLSHYEEGTGVPPRDPIDFALLACDEITGLILAAALIRPDRDIRALTLDSLRKKWKNARFAAGVDRAHVTAATADFSRVCFNNTLDLWQHLEHVLAAMQEIAADLDLTPQPT